MTTPRDAHHDNERTVLLDLAALADYTKAADKARPQQPDSGKPAPGGGKGDSLVRSSASMMVFTAISRLTGFLRNIAIAAAISFGFVADAFNTANTLPNIIYELLLGGVLTSVVVPLLVHAQHQDDDQGEAYAQRLLSLATVTLACATLLAVIAAPLLTALYVGSGSPKAELTTVFALLLLPQIFFYGVGAMFGAVLNTRGVFGPPAWAPIANNLIAITACMIFIALPGPANLTPDSITTSQILVLGIGSTLGIVVQALIVIPALRRTGFRWRWRLQVRKARLGEARTLALWVLAYVAISQVGYVVVTRLANDVDIANKSYAVLVNASLLFQMPYGILGVSLLTALMPRMSRAAARGDMSSLVADLSLGTRLSTVALLPIAAIFTVLGPALGTVLYSLGRAEDGGRQVGIVLAVSAFGLVPFAITMLQLRAFYAIKDARTPTLINVAMVAFKIVLSLALAATLPPEHVVAGLAVANSLSFVLGVFVGEVLLRRRFGALESSRVVNTAFRMTVASVAGGLAAWAALVLISTTLGLGATGSLVSLLIGSVFGVLIIICCGLLLKIDELREISGRLRHRVGTT